MNNEIKFAKFILDSSAEKCTDGDRYWYELWGDETPLEMLYKTFEMMEKLKGTYVSASKEYRLSED